MKVPKSSAPFDQRRNARGPVLAFVFIVGIASSHSWATAQPTNSQPPVGAEQNNPNRGSGHVVGVVVNAATGKTLAGAVVKVRGTELTAHTDETGKYVLN